MQLQFFPAIETCCYHFAFPTSSQSTIRRKKYEQDLLPGDPTFLIVTDRVDLDHQIYDNFLTTGAGGIFKKLPVFLNYIAILLENDRRVKEFKVYENTISMLYEAFKPEILERNRFSPLVPVFQYLRALLDVETVFNMIRRYAESGRKWAA